MNLILARVFPVLSTKTAVVHLLSTECKMYGRAQSDPQFLFRLFIVLKEIGVEIFYVFIQCEFSIRGYFCRSV